MHGNTRDTGAQQSFLTHPDPGINSGLGLCRCRTRWMSLLHRSSEEHQDLLESFLPDPTRGASGVVWELPAAHPVGNDTQGEMKSVRVHQEAKQSPASAQSSRSAVS